MELSDFARKWSHPDYPPERVNESDLIAAETELGIKFPEDYRAQVLNVGLPRPTLALLSAIVDRGMELNDLSVLHNPKAVVEIRMVGKQQACRSILLQSEATAVGVASASM